MSSEWREYSKFFTSEPKTSIALDASIKVPKIASFEEELKLEEKPKNKMKIPISQMQPNSDFEKWRHDLKLKVLQQRKDIKARDINMHKRNQKKLSNKIK